MLMAPAPCWTMRLAAASRSWWRRSSPRMRVRVPSPVAAPFPDPVRAGAVEPDALLLPTGSGVTRRSRAHQRAEVVLVEELASGVVGAVLVERALEPPDGVL